MKSLSQVFQRRNRGVRIPGGQRSKADGRNNLFQSRQPRREIVPFPFLMFLADPGL